MTGGFMATYATADIRNIALVGHQGAGKTSLAEAILFRAGVIGRMGTIKDKSSHLDTDDEEKERGTSIESHTFSVEHNGKLLNFVDTPGAPDFIGPAIAALAAVETAVVVVEANAGIQVNTRRMRDLAKSEGLARVVVINHMDAPNADLEGLLGSLQETFGKVLTPVNLPAAKGTKVVNCLNSGGEPTDFGDVKDIHLQIVERVAECDEALMNKYFETGELTDHDVHSNIARAIKAGTLVPVVFTNAIGPVGVNELLDVLVEECPSPLDGKQREIVDGEKRTPVKPDPNGPFVAQVFKVAVDHKSHIKYCVARVHSGTLKGDAILLASGEKKGERSGHVLKLSGVERKEIEAAVPGDIVAFAKVDFHIGQTLYTSPTEGDIPMPKLPTPMFSLAIMTKARGDEAKIGEAVKKLTEVDPCFKTHQDAQTHETVISGIGDLHLRVMLSQLKRQSKIEVDTKPPKIPYRETITAKADGHYRHKKQSGGAGQFGEVFLKVEPLERGSDPTLEFDWAIFGGSIPGGFEPAIKKGVHDMMERGPLAGFPVQDVKVSITDGKHHPVDSKEVAFRIAGKKAFEDAILKAKPVLLEPYVDIEVTVPSENVGDITGDLAQRRGRPSGQDMIPGGFTIITAQAPLAKLSDYNSRLSSITGGKGTYSMELSHFEPVPSNEAQPIIAEYKRHDKDDE
jgi:elongation factor G